MSLIKEIGPTLPLKQKPLGPYIPPDTPPHSQGTESDNSSPHISPIGSPVLSLPERFSASILGINLGCAKKHKNELNKKNTTRKRLPKILTQNNS